jgi:hypothetical protein
MEVQITHSGIANDVTVSASVPGIVQVVPVVPMSVEVQLFRDGKHGKSAYELWLLDGNVGTVSEFVNSTSNFALDLLARYQISKL